ncbi:MAG: phosphatidate cytidylyltransferase [Clostridia bacterium]|nr:phosphatidate cytidylyltransferase [Clostridia bacterium]
MIKRLLTSAGVIITITGFFLLRQFVDYRLFNVLVFGLMITGTFEMVRAFKEKLTFFVKCVIWAYAISIVPLMTFFADVWAPVTFAAMLLIVSSLVFEFDAIDPEKAGVGMLALFYPAGLITAMAAVNGFGKTVAGDSGFIPLLLIFVIAPFADAGAYIVGSIVKGKKLSPVISPNKTISGFIGGLVAGALGAFLIWLVFPSARGAVAGVSWEWALYIMIGFIASAVSTFGDLVEGALKRKLDIKDMGGLLPGHGGMLDRIDSTMYVAVLILVLFAFLGA